jgi:hypothetical protein
MRVWVSEWVSEWVRVAANDLTAAHTLTTLPYAQPQQAPIHPSNNKKRKKGTMITSTYNNIRSSTITIFMELFNTDLAFIIKTGVYLYKRALNSIPIPIPILSMSAISNNGLSFIMI